MSKVDLGEATGPRTVISGLAQLIPADQLLNRLVVVLCNLKPAKMKGIESQGMVLCASVAEPRQVEPLDPPVDSQIGDRVFVEGYSAGTPNSENKENSSQEYEILNPKKKAWDKIQVDLLTSSSCAAEWRSNPLLTTKGNITTKSMKNAPIK